MQFTDAKAVVLQVDKSGTDKCGRRCGVLKQLYARNQLTPFEQQFLSFDNVLQEREATFHEAANTDTMGKVL